MTGLLKELFGYHAWANLDLLDKLGTIEPRGNEEQLHTARRLISHYYVVAQIFAAHLKGEAHSYLSDNTDHTPSLLELRSLLAASDEWYVDYVATASPADLSKSLAFTFTDGDKGYMRCEEMLMQVVLHGGYHRGEIGRLLWQLSVTPPWDTFAVYLHQTEPERRAQGARPGG